MSARSHTLAFLAGVFATVAFLVLLGVAGAVQAQTVRDRTPPHTEPNHRSGRY